MEAPAPDRDVVAVQTFAKAMDCGGLLSTWFPGKMFGVWNKETIRGVDMSGIAFEGAMSAFMLYAGGFLVLLAGLVYGAFLLHVPETWIAVGALVIFGLGVMSAVSHTKQRDVPKAPDA